MAYDVARGVTVLFGGAGAFGIYYGDTWELVGCGTCLGDINESDNC